MSQDTLATVTLATIENYRQAATRTAQAYRSGSRRLVGAMVAGLEQQFDPRAGRFAPRATERLVEWRKQAQKLVLGGIDAVTRSTEQAVDLGSAGASRQVKRVTGLAARLESPLIATPLQAAARLALPGAQLALVVSDKLAEGAGALNRAARGNGAAAKADAAMHAAEAPVRRARRQTQAATGQVAKAARTMKAEDRKTVTRARRKVA